MAIIINNESDFMPNISNNHVSLYSDKHIEVETSTTLNPGDKHRFIFDVYDPYYVFYGRFKTIAYSYPNGVFNIAKVARNLFRQLGLNEAIPYVFNNSLFYTNKKITVNLEIGEEINNVEYLNLASAQLEFFNGHINLNNLDKAALGWIYPNITPLFAMPNKRHLYYSDTSKTLIPYSPILNSTGTPVIDNLTAKTFDENGNVITSGISGMGLRMINEGLAYYGGGAVSTGLISALHGSNYELESSYITDTIQVKYLCEPFTELYFINSYGAYEQFIFTYEKESSDNEKALLNTRDKVYSSNVITNVVYPKTYNVNTMRTLSLSKMAESLNEYKSFIELVNSPSVYLVRDSYYLPCEVITSNTDGYVPRYDKIKEMNIQIKYQWK